jgi:hypothetical protein
VDIYVFIGADMANNTRVARYATISGAYNSVPALQIVCAHFASLSISPAKLPPMRPD